MDDFIKEEIKILEAYDFSGFRYEDNFLLFFVLSFLLPAMLKDDLAHPISDFLFILIPLFFLLISKVLRFMTNFKVKKMGIDKHLFLDNREWERAVSIPKFFNERRSWLLNQYKNNQIDPEVLKKLYLRKEVRWKSL